MSAAPPSGGAGMEIRSFSVIFRLERRLHRIDRFRLPLPYGLPLRALAYGLGALCLLVLAGQLPGLADLVGLLPPPVRYLLLPGAIGFALARARVDGRPAHGFLVALARHHLGPRHLSAFRRVPAPGTELRVVEELTLACDHAGPRLRRGRLRGPAELTLRYPALATQRGPVLSLAQAGDRPMRRGKRITVAEGQEVRFS